MPYMPWLLGNEQQTIWCSNSGILCAMEMVEGKDVRLSSIGKTVGLLLHLTCSIWGSSKVAELYSGFFCIILHG